MARACCCRCQTRGAADRPHWRAGRGTCSSASRTWPVLVPSCAAASATGSLPVMMRLATASRSMSSGSGPGRVRPGAAEGRRGPGQRLADAEVVQEGGGVVVQRVPQLAGEGVGEGVVVAVVAGGGEREGVPGVVQVGAGEQLEQVTLGVVVPWGFTGVGGGAVAQVAPLPGGDGCGGDEVAAALVVDGAAAGVQVTGQAGDRGEYRVVAVAGQGPQLRADGQGAAVGVQGGDGRAGGAAGVAGQQQARGDGAAERASREPSGGHQPDRPLGP